MKSCHGNVAEMQLDSIAVTSATVRRGIGPRTCSSAGSVLFHISVALRNFVLARRALSAAFGTALNIDTVATDRRTGWVTLRLQLTAGCVGEAMVVVMRAVPEAQFGMICPGGRVSRH